MERDYIANSSREFTLIGRADALADSRKLMDEILDELLPIYSKEGVLERLKNYLIGYRIGLLERDFIKKGIYGSFDWESKYYIKANNETIKMVNTYQLYLNEAEQEARRTLEIKVGD